VTEIGKTRQKRLVGAVALSLAASTAVVIALLISSRSTPSSYAVDEPPVLPASPEPALKVPSPVRLKSSAGVAQWASVRHAVSVRASASSEARFVTRLASATPEGTANIVLVLRRAKDRAGRLWVRVRLPVLPNGSTGWVPRQALGVYGVVNTHLVVDLEGLTATLMREERPILRVPIGVGRPEWPTPKGEFYVRNMLTRYRSPFYGPLAFGTSARSSVLTDWPGGGFIGIHGTDAPELLPGRVSHGCIRLRNEDILQLGRLMPVGTPVTIR
jgi:lipoprotein-anchoring transpeptidase ErfK/SrfK